MTIEIIRESRRAKIIREGIIIAAICFDDNNDGTCTNELVFSSTTTHTLEELKQIVAFMESL